MPGTALDALDRPATLTSLGSGTFDLLVIGGGITGAGVARDAALRGLSVALVEAEDFAAGTSNRSSKLIHGGLRYLAMGDVALVRETALERKAVHAMAPHLAEPCWMLVPAAIAPACSSSWRVSRPTRSSVRSRRRMCIATGMPRSWRASNPIWIAVLTPGPVSTGSI
ncbi:MAG: FAD-dependent oxidoreductase [Gammaproteobacteria bacterium]|nr:FAD-dependent oxidoreductase [Gammaproteobacteria bacterium]